jgi:hypothetical protein
VPFAKAAPLQLGDATALQRGDPVFVIGNPLGMSFTMSQGIVSHPTRRSVGLSYVQIDLSVSPGNSGGPLLDAHGRVVGLVTYKVGEDARIGLALAINHLYTGDKPLIAAPESYAKDAWEEELRAAWKESRQEHAETLAQLGQPMLLRARHARGTFYAAIGYMGQARAPGQVVLELAALGAETCKGMKVSVRNWRVIGKTMQDTTEMPPSLRTWVERNKIENEIKLGIAEFPMSRCPHVTVGSAELALQGGMPGFDRVTIEY